MDSRITNADLGVNDVALLVDRLVFDGLVERCIYAGPRISMIVSDDEDTDVYVYKAVQSALAESIFGSMPCGVCPVSLLRQWSLFYLKVVIMNVCTHHHRCLICALTKDPSLRPAATTIHNG